MTNQDIAKLTSSPVILTFIDTIIQNLLQTETNDRQDQQNIQHSDIVLKCGTIIKDIRIMYDAIEKSKLDHLNRSNDLLC